ncbi:MAG: asparaginase [Candidatus Methanomethylicota archaeon]|uniref:Plant-type L-asparaginase n=1 Tax=Thermoproteota archaeon TaxID=2056631 RepID=A0A497F293_9CREN|nr:MAG: asparaginase [Candidatus Verstraetearchaeota archaeon]
MKVKPVILIHGGAGNYRAFPPEDLEKRRAWLKKAALEGFKVLTRESALDAVEVAVKVMEDSGVFNAGLGSVLCLNKRVEMDAAIMDGRDLGVGAVACISGFKNPVSIARKIMEETDHILIVGKAAEKLAEFFGFKRTNNLITESKLNRFEKVYRDWIEGRRRRMMKIRKMVLEKKGIFDLTGTVGAVAIDSEGNLASAVSTGGYWLKLPGRVGDVPLVGCGFYADNECGAASATGVGELIARLTLSKLCCDMMRTGISAQKACEAAIDLITSKFGEGNAGIIAIDRQGRWGFAFNTAGMGRAIMADGMDEPKVAIFREEEFPMSI